MIEVKGFKFSGISAGLKKSGKKDLGLIYSEAPCVAHAIFTKNKVLAAPLIVGKSIIKKNSIQSIIVNSGNANACTGNDGILATKEILKCIASYAKMKTYNFFPSSTGIIGEKLNYEIIKKKFL